MVVDGRASAEGSISLQCRTCSCFFGVYLALKPCHRAPNMSWVLLVLRSEIVES